MDHDNIYTKLHVFHVREGGLASGAQLDSLGTNVAVCVMAFSNRLEVCCETARKFLRDNEGWQEVNTPEQLWQPRSEFECC